MNLDRVVSVTSLLIGLSGIGLSIYLSKPESNANVVSLSGWIASVLITLILSTSAFIAMSRLQKEIAERQKEVLIAKNESIKHKDDLMSQHNDLVQYRNISAALSSMINPDPIRESIRNKLAAYADSGSEQKEEV